MQIREGVVGCLYMAGHRNRQVIYSLRTSLSKSSKTDVLRVKLPPVTTAKKYKKNLKPRRKRRLLVFLAARDGSWSCWYCGKKLTPITDIEVPLNPRDPAHPTIDHVIPLSRGGTHETHNLRMACTACNQDKADTV